MRFRPMILILTVGAVTMLSGCASMLREPESAAFQRDYPTAVQQQTMRDAQRAADDAAAEARRVDEAFRQQALRTHMTAHDPSTPAPPALPPGR